MAELAAEAERAGWDGVFLEDYIGYQGQAGTPTYDPWVTMVAMAIATSRVRMERR
jgi:alkanesulfonate monooxygenase SsuD/methylene tetrahydromethanopterin reductase-like flavin-dependent oxidoreductase (luciferase family)